MTFDNRYHAHLDVCAQCARNPFGLCLVGATLLKQETLGARKPQCAAHARRAVELEPACPWCDVERLTAEDLRADEAFDAATSTIEAQRDQIAKLVAGNQKIAAERDAANALVVLLRNVVSASLHGNAQEKANAYAALNRHDKAVREAARKGGT